MSRRRRRDGPHPRAGSRAGRAAGFGPDDTHPTTAAALPENPAALVVVLMAVLLLLALLTAALILYRRRQSAERGAFEGARYSRGSSGPGEATEKNILVSDMEMNEQQD